MDEIKTFDIATTVTDSIIDLFDTMLSMKLELADESAAKLEGDRIVCVVSFAGKVKGSIIIQISEAFSRTMTAAMLGVAPEEITGMDDIKDAISEVCNVVGGNLKSNFCDVGLTCRLSTPSFTLGSDFKVESLNTSRHERFVFLFQSNLVTVDVGVGVSDAAETDERLYAPLQPKGTVDPSVLMRFDLKTPFLENMIEVFDMMLSMKLAFSEKDSGATLGGERIVGGVSFVGYLMGSMNIYVSDELARQMTSSMLGKEAGETIEEGEIKDVIAEVCSIVGGNLKSKFTDAGLICELSTPSFTSGRDFIIESSQMMRYERLALRYGEQVLFVEIGAKFSEGQAAEASESSARIASRRQAFLANDAQRNIDEILSTRLPDAPHSPEKKEPPQPETPTMHRFMDGIPPSANGTAPRDLSEKNLDLILDIPLEIKVELGRSKRTIEDLLRIAEGSVVELMKLSGEPVDVLVNNKLIARGEVVVDNEKYGVRITETVSRIGRIRTLQ